jgi:putative copper resistance protein D
VVGRLSGPRFAASPLAQALNLAVALPFVAALVTTVALGDRGYVALSLDVPGLATSLTSAMLHAGVLLASALCVGGLFHAGFLRSRCGVAELEVPPAELGLVQTAALAWSLCAWALVVVDAADASGQPLLALTQPGALRYLVEASYLPRAWIVVAVLTGAVTLVAHHPPRPGAVRGWPAVAGMLALSVTAVLPPVLVTQVLVGPNHDLGSDAATLGAPAATLAFGSVMVAALRSGAGQALPPAEARRFRASLTGFVAVALAADVVVGLFETWPFPPAPTATAWLFALRLLLLGVAVAWIVVPRLPGARRSRARARGPRLLGPVLILLAAGSAARLAMSRIPPPQYFVPSTIRQNFLGYDVDVAPAALRLLVDWRVNLLFLAVALTAILLYLRGVRLLRRRGDAWPVGRTLAWLAGWAVVVLTTSSGLGRYSNASFSMHMLLHMSLNMFGPLLMCLGGPVTLALRAARPRPSTAAAGPREWVSALMDSRLARWSFHPVHVFVTFVGSYYVLYLTPLFDHAMRYHWAHQLMNLDFLVVGYLFYSLIIGVDRPPRAVPHIAKLGLLLAAMPFHAFFGVIVMTSDTIIAHTFYSYLQPPWHPDLAADQYLGGGIAWAAGEVPLVAVVIALMVQWSRSDARDSARLDRHLDTGLDDSFEAYNAMLAQFAGRGAAGAHPGSPIPDRRRNDTP